MEDPEQDLLNELLERINNAEKRNEDLRKDIKNKKNELKRLDDKIAEEKEEESKSKIENEKEKKKY
jgi:hypothetical protein